MIERARAPYGHPVCTGAAEHASARVEFIRPLLRLHAASEQLAEVNPVMQLTKEPMP